MTEPDFVERTRWSYDAGAADYAEWIRAEWPVKPLDRAVLDGFAEIVRMSGHGPVADLGCGSGRVTARLTDLGLSAFGVDLSPKMVAAARRTYPGLCFDEGSMFALDIADGVLGGIVAWYSIIHVPDEWLPGVFAEFARVLAPGAHAQIAFQVGEEVVHRSKSGRNAVSLDFHLRQPDRVAELLSEAGLAVRARMVREPDEGGDFPESTPQGFVLVRKPHRPGE